MQETLGHDPHPWQADILSTLFLKKHGEPYLLVRPTGGGKSMIRDTFSSAKPGTIVLSLAPLLSRLGVTGHGCICSVAKPSKNIGLGDFHRFGVTNMAFTIDKGINTNI